MGILLRNWHLKLSAVMLATVLYTGLVFSGSFSESTIRLRVEGVNAPDNSIVLSGDLGLVEVRYRTANDLPTTISDQAFTATVDLSEYAMDRAPEPQVLDVEIVSLVEGVEIVGVVPPTVRVAIDRVAVRTVPVEVDPGDVPDGLEIDRPVASEEEVEVRGPASVVGAVDRAVALVRIDASGIDVNQPVTLVAYDVQGQPVGEGLIDIEPETVSVQIDVQPTETTQTLTVRPIIQGRPAPGFALESLDPLPVTVILRGLPEVLASVEAVDTEPINIDGLSATQEIEAALVVPDGTRLADDGAEAAVTVTVTIVPSVSSRTFVVGVTCAGEGDNACLPAVDQLTITLSGPGGVLSGLSAGDITPSVDASGLDPGTYELTPSVAALPEGIELLDIAPSPVSVTIQAPATPPPSPTPAP